MTLSFTPVFCTHPPVANLSKAKQSVAKWSADKRHSTQTLSIQTPLAQGWTTVLTALFLATGLSLLPLTVQAQTANGQGDSSAATSSEQTLVQQGAYLARAGDCVACHTAPGGKPFAGGLQIDSPFGVIYSSNITPDPTSGIGNWSEADFARAVRQGKRKDGANLYPAMPYPSYAHLSDQDVHALYVYFRHGVQPVDSKPPTTHLHFPFNQRWGLSVWDWLFAGVKPYPNTPQVNDALHRGAYLVEGLGHCGSCHTPRGIAFQEKALNGTSDNYLAGGTINGWTAPSLRGKGDGADGIQQWSAQDIAEYLATGRNTHSAVVGDMTSVVANSTSYMSPQDLMDIATYLKSLPNNANSPTQSESQQAIQHTAKYLAAARDLNQGQHLYIDNCAACHQVTGQGAGETFPAIAGSAITNASDATGLIRVILDGSRMPSTPKRPEALAMPDFGWRLSNEEVAALTTFLRSAWGNHAEGVSADQVAKVRKSLPPVQHSSAPGNVDGVPAADQGQ